jgi:hypothetical protein
MDGVLIMKSKIFTNSVGIFPNTDKANDNSYTHDNIQQSVFHTILIPLGLSLGSTQAGLLYFAIAMIAYFTIFSDKNYYVKAILKTVIAFSVVGIAWFALIGFVGMIASIMGVSA